MTARELIKKLKDLPPDATVQTVSVCYNGYTEVFSDEEAILRISPGGHIFIIPDDPNYESWVMEASE